MSCLHTISRTGAIALSLLLVIVTQALAQSVTVSAVPATFNGLGDNIRFDYVIDPGSYTITSINPTTTSIKGAVVSCPSVGSGLEWPNKLTCTAAYRVDELDVMAGQFSDFASFSGTRVGGHSFSFTSNTLVVRAVAGGPVVLSVTSSPNPSLPGQEVEVTATVSSMGCNAGQSPPGSVSISIGSQSANLGLAPTGPVSPASSATFRTTSLSSGTYPVSASYTGGSGCSTSSASGSNHTVETKPTVTINQATAQADPTSRSPILFDVAFDKPIVGFSGADVQSVRHGRRHHGHDFWFRCNLSGGGVGHESGRNRCCNDPSRKCHDTGRPRKRGVDEFGQFGLIRPSQNHPGRDCRSSLSTGLWSGGPGRERR
ncbi:MULTISPECIES: Ig-like domain-containing protein [unclassified Rhizobium]|uniref:Ig-like domain-containing protein n=1 Tax=unclassified Rhizobium TaxID=2613769 RepID=UPI0027D41A81|nr:MULTISPECIES: Ig-like domain-containing protein [unclassified Rhizobium]MDQ4404966.1 Ig-like domain-containing protein [Rhizobium sp. AN63]